MCMRKYRFKIEYVTGAEIQISFISIIIAYGSFKNV